MKPAAITVLLACGALSSACHDPSDYDLTEDKVESILTLEVTGPASIPADGFTTTTLTARIHPENANNRSLFITTDRGTLLKGGEKPTDGTFTVTAGPDGSVTFDLRSSTGIGTATVIATVNNQPLIAASKTVAFEAANPDDTIRFVALPTEMPADGASQATIEVQLNAALPEASRQAAFETTLGTLLPSSKIASADAEGIARITLQSSASVGSARISAATASVLRETVVEFIRALPATISASSTSFTVTAAPTSTLELTGHLTRNTGIVTDGTAVIFEAMRADTRAPIGIFRNITSSSAGRVSASFLPGATDYRGDVEVRISLNDRSISGSTIIRVLAP